MTLWNDIRITIGTAIRTEKKKKLAPVFVQFSTLIVIIISIRAAFLRR